MLNLHDVPSEILSYIFNFCDSDTLRILNQTCKRFREIVLSHSHWLKRSKRCFVTNQNSTCMMNRSYAVLSPFDKCRIEGNWKVGLYKYKQLLKERCNYMPWLQLDSNYVWVSFGKNLKSYKRQDIKKTLKQNRNSSKLQTIHTLGNERGKGDIGRFLKKGNIILWNQDEYINAWREDTQQKIFKADILLLTQNQFLRNSRSYIRNTNDALDFENDNIVFSINKAVYISTFDGLATNDAMNLDIWERDCWRLKLNGKSNVVAGASQSGPLYLYDLQKSIEISEFGGHRPFNTAVDICWHGSLILTAGYDSKLYVWDPRTNLTRAQLELEDPFNSDFYCICSDNFNSVLCGMQLNARVNSYDLRVGKIVQVYYMETQESSPVYSLSFDPTHLYCATGRGLHLLDFEIYDGRRKNYQEWLLN